MRLRNSDAGYGLVAKFLHWSTALLIAGLIGLGYYMVGLTYYDRWYHQSLEAHKAFGVLVFVLGALTLGWRWLSPSPPHVATLKRWERTAATAMHHTLFALVLLIPLTGFLVSTSEGKGVDLFGWFVVPALVVVGEQLRELAIKVHLYCAYGAAVLVLMHAGAAFKHQLIDRDGTLARMLWR